MSTETLPPVKQIGQIVPEIIREFLFDLEAYADVRCIACTGKDVTGKLFPPTQRLNRCFLLTFNEDFMAHPWALAVGADLLPVLRRVARAFFTTRDARLAVVHHIRRHASVGCKHIFVIKQYSSVCYRHSV